MLYRGEDVTELPPHRKAALGIGRTFQNVGMVKSETVLENLLTAQHLKAGYGALTGLTGVGVVRQREKDLAAHADAILELLGLTEFRNRPLRQPVLRHAEAARARLRAGHRPRPAAARRAVERHGAGGGARARRPVARAAPGARR